MSHWIIYSLFLYIIYKIVKGLVFPAIHITNAVNGKLKNMQEQMKNMEQQQKQKSQQRKKEGEYIDYEEIK